MTAFFFFPCLFRFGFHVMAQEFMAKIHGQEFELHH